MATVLSHQKLINRVNSALNYDFCPSANRWVYWMKHPLVGMAVVAVAAGTCALFVSPQAWLLAFGLLMIAGVGLLWPLLGIWAVRVDVHFDRAWVEEQSVVPVRVLLRNRLPIPMWGLSLSRREDDNELLVSFARVPALRTTEYTWQFTPQRRGVFPGNPLQLETGFPFGVWTARKPAVVDGEILVLPRPVEIDTIPELDSRGGMDELFSEYRTGDSGDVTGTRSFREGDSLRRVHWAMTARSGRLICTERQATIHASVTCAVDLIADHHEGGGSDSSLEWTIRIFCGICREFQEQGVNVRASLGGTTLQLLPGKAGLRALLIALARVPREGYPRESGRSSWTRADVVVGTERSSISAAAVSVMLLARNFREDSSESLGDLQADDVKRGSVVLRNRDEIGSSLRTSWRKACHAAS
ncbi:DUF58 domain-containing protein [Rubinisphaera margarita]|uniref:DUF58 domain-containing protein n=1 Tax=Rubinisphaera margarita TaxID=2909586 RepID=UPI001EE9AA56|nr:DUF58 domain-containing protein [Rubinisphaera margarita]MCG6156597.1 DUF58 domain-containing protein [Rubinisphaera margarita]